VGAEPTEGAHKNSNPGAVEFCRASRERPAQLFNLLRVASTRSQILPRLCILTHPKIGSLVPVISPRRLSRRLFCSGLFANMLGARCAELEGTWAAKEGKREFWGTWTAQRDADAGYVWGAWQLLDPSGKPVLRGTWAARKAENGWHGTWTARIRQGREFSGTWQASLSLPPESEFFSLFEASVKKDAGGTWKAGNHAGTWAIRASASPCVQEPKARRVE